MSRFEKCVHFVVVDVPLDSVYGVPGTDAVYVVLDGAASVRAYKSRNETCEDGLVYGCSMFLANVSVITEQVENEKTGSVRAASLRRVGFT